LITDPKREPNTKKKVKKGLRLIPREGRTQEAGQRKTPLHPVSQVSGEPGREKGEEKTKEFKKSGMNLNTASNGVGSIARRGKNDDNLGSGANTRGKARPKTGKNGGSTLFENLCQK